MKKIRAFCLSIFSTIFMVSAFSQGTVQSIVPNAALPGQFVEITIRCEGTGFQLGAVSVSLGSGVLVQKVTVNNSFTLVVSAQILQTAMPSFRDLRIANGEQTIEMFNAFEVLDASGDNVFAILEINPVQVLYAADFDPNNLDAAPLVFQVTVLNDQQTRDLKTFFYLIHSSDGLILTAEKKHPEVQPGAVMTFDNREFDEFDLNDANSSIVFTTLVTGVLPPGVYTYRIEVKQGNTVLASAEGTNMLLNQAGDMVIISPGSDLESGLPPENQVVSQPLFQWISSANYFDLFLYEVTEGQTNAQEIVQSMPVYRELSISSTSFLYPLSAEPLELGKIYAWQLRAHFNAPSGNGYFDSPVYWFEFGEKNILSIPIGSIEIFPNFLELDTESRRQFEVVIKDLQGNILEVEPTWRVLPDETFGAVDTTGFFVAGKNPRMGAVEVRFGDYSAHCIVNLEFAGFSFDILDIIFRNAQRTVINTND
jgi:hypothetical protein